MPITGGYVIHKNPLVKPSNHSHTASLPRPVSALDLEAVNAVQETPWRINRWVLDVMLEAWANGQRIAGLEVGEPHAIPARFAADVWAAMPSEDRKEHTKRLHEIYSKNASIMGRSRAVLDSLSVADELRDYDSIYYPHTKDFRHRIYPMAAHGPNPQGSDIDKSLLMFAEGVPLGDDGEFWLCVRAANCFGHDKLPLEERVKWTLQHTSHISASTADPLGCSWWTKADEPWSFLATCNELQHVWNSSKPQDFVSHLPVPMDGTCNGLQHLSAMGRDPIGAAATNLAPGPRQDIYEKVAERVRELVQEDVLAGVDEAHAWHGKVTRKSVKRAIMTTPYGVTDRGIRDQLLADGVVPEDAECGRNAAAVYLKDKIVVALGDTVSAAKGIMAWLRVCADRLAKAGLPFDWQTPSGSTVRQGYHTTTAGEIKTLCGNLLLLKENEQAGLNARKQAAGASPNFIHSFDAAHLSMTVVAAHRRGIKAWSLIHDSFGTHAGNTTVLAREIREQFVAIYQEDWLAKTYRALVEAHPHVDIPLPPEVGTFDIRQVLSAEFFFS